MKFLAVLMLAVFGTGDANARDIDYHQSNDLLAENNSKLICKIENNIQFCTDQNYVPYTGLAFTIHPKKSLIGKLFHIKPKLKEEINFKNGKRDGLYKSYYENGQLEDERHYKNGIYNG